MFTCLISELFSVHYSLVLCCNVYEGPDSIEDAVLKFIKINFFYDWIPHFFFLWLGSTLPKWVSARDVKAVVRHYFPFTDVTDYFLITE